MTIFSIQCSGRVDGDGEHSIRLIDVCPVHGGGLLIVSPHLRTVTHLYNMQTLYMHVSTLLSHIAQWGDAFTEHGVIGKIFVAKKYLVTPSVFKLQKWFLE